MSYRRLLVALVASLALVVGASPVLAGSETFRFTASSSFAYGSFTNLPMDGEELPPGTYFYTDVWASEWIVTGDAAYEEGSVCVFHGEFTIDADGNWTGEQWLGACASGADLSIARRLTGASVMATLPVEECLAWDEASGECLEVVSLGTILVDLSWIGDGPIYRSHGSYSGGVAGYYQYASHGTASGRDALLAGSATLTRPDGSEADLTGGLDGSGFMWQSRGGSVEVIITHG